MVNFKQEGWKTLVEIPIEIPEGFPIIIGKKTVYVPMNNGKLLNFSSTHFIAPKTPLYMYNKIHPNSSKQIRIYGENIFIMLRSFGDILKQKEIDRAFNELTSIDIQAFQIDIYNEKNHEIFDKFKINFLLCLGINPYEEINNPFWYRPVVPKIPLHEAFELCFTIK